MSLAPRVKQIEVARARNNKNWMDLLRLALRSAPVEAKALLVKIGREDAAIHTALQAIAHEPEAASAEHT